MGDKIIVSDNLATHGIAIMSVREGLEFETTIESDTRSSKVSILRVRPNFIRLVFKFILLKSN